MDGMGMSMLGESTYCIFSINYFVFIIIFFFLLSTDNEKFAKFIFYTYLNTTLRKKLYCYLSNQPILEGLNCDA